MIYLLDFAKSYRGQNSSSTNVKVVLGPGPHGGHLVRRLQQDGGVQRPGQLGVDVQGATPRFAAQSLPNGIFGIPPLKERLGAGDQSVHTRLRTGLHSGFISFRHFDVRLEAQADVVR